MFRLLFKETRRIRVLSESNSHVGVYSALCQSIRFPTETRREFSSETSSKSRTAAIRLYRVLQRQCTQLEKSAKQKNDDLFLLQAPLNSHDAGTSRIIMPATEDCSLEASILRFFYLHQEDKGIEDDDVMCEFMEHVIGKMEDKKTETSKCGHESVALWVNLGALRRAIKLAFQSTGTEESSLSRRKQWAIQAYQLLMAQQNMLHLTSMSYEHDIKITVTSKCVAKSFNSLQQSPAISQQQAAKQYASHFWQREKEEAMKSQMKYRYAYRIRIENKSATDTVQLLGRTWVIYDDYRDDPETNPPKKLKEGKELTIRNEPIRVHAPTTGAVGKLPILRPGMAFEYMSGSEAGPEGLMKGCFHFGKVIVDFAEEDMNSMPSLDDVYHISTAPAHNMIEEKFEVPVAPFPLSSAAFEE